jgi:putative transposase
MPNHWHLVLWPRKKGELSEFMRWLTVTHTQRWHASHRTSGTGPLYQGRFKSFPIEDDDHLLAVVRYVERNALRAKLVARAEGVALVEFAETLECRARQGSGRGAAHAA